MMTRQGVVGIGVDIQRISQLESACKSPDDPFIRRVYTKAEAEEALRRSRPLSYYATRFAAKEAVFKCLNLSGEGVALRDIEISNHPNGAPTVSLYGQLAQRAGERGIQHVLISLSHDGDYAIAYALAMGSHYHSERDEDLELT